jgi:hypothetical protein
MERINSLDIKKNFPYNSGSEALIYDIGGGKLYKEWLPTASLSKSKNKENKLLLISEIKDIRNFYPEIYSMVDSLLGIFPRGYILEKIENSNFKVQNYKDRIEVLKTIKDTLESFMKHDIYYIDLRIPNLKVLSKNKVVFLDIDNIALSNYEIDLIPTFMNTYYKYHKYTDRSSVIAAFNLFMDNYLKTVHYTKDGNKIINLKNTEDTIFDHEYLLDYIDMELTEEINEFINDKSKTITKKIY